MAAGIVLGCLVGVASVGGPWLMTGVLCGGIVATVRLDRRLRESDRAAARRERLKASARRG